MCLFLTCRDASGQPSAAAARLEVCWWELRHRFRRLSDLHRASGEHVQYVDTHSVKHLYSSRWLCANWTSLCEPGAHKALDQFKRGRVSMNMMQVSQHLVCFLPPVFGENFSIMFCLHSSWCCLWTSEEMLCANRSHQKIKMKKCQMSPAATLNKYTQIVNTTIKCLSRPSVVSHRIGLNGSLPRKSSNILNKLK